MSQEWCILEVFSRPKKRPYLPLRQIFFVDSICLCPSCQFCFCVLCERSSHGNYPCEINRENFQEISEEYQNATDQNDTAKIDFLLAKYGANLQHIITFNQNMGYIHENAVPCPKCRHAIVKINGCNHMTCKQCWVSFFFNFLIYIFNTKFFNTIIF